MTKIIDNQQETMRRLAGVIRLLREKEGVSLRVFAKNAKIDFSALYRLEMGSNLNPSIFLIRRVAKSFGMTVDELMNFDAKECPTCKGAGWIRR